MSSVVCGKGLNAATHQQAEGVTVFYGLLVREKPGADRFTSYTLCIVYTHPTHYTLCYATENYTISLKASHPLLASLHTGASQTCGTGGWLINPG